MEPVLLACRRRGYPCPHTQLACGTSHLDKKIINNYKKKICFLFILWLAEKMQILLLRRGIIPQLPLALCGIIGYQTYSQTSFLPVLRNRNRRETVTFCLGEPKL
jgi:hypothetical protein